MKNKILKITGLALLVLLSFVWAAPYLFKGKIVNLLKASATRDLNAHVNFSGVDISWFRHFPKITIGLDNLQVICVGEFQGDTLMAAKQLNITCDLASFVSGDSIKIKSIAALEPRLHAYIHKNGHSNWNITKSDGPTPDLTGNPARAFKLELQQYNITNGYVNYQDESKDIHIEIMNLEHEGKGNFMADTFSLKTKTTADALSIDSKGAIPYRITAKTKIELALRVENKSHIFSFNTDEVSFNDLKLHTEGFFQWINDSSYSMNIRFKAPSTKFKNILSMLPSVYQNDFKSIETNGQVNFNGFIKGKYDDKHFPAYHANLFVMNGYFKYPDLALPLENINLGIQVDNPDGVADHTVINMSEGHAEINKDILDLHLFVKNLKTRPFIDFGFVGKLDLSNISRMIKLEPGTQLSGILSSDIHAKGNIPATEPRKKDPFQAFGNLEIRNLSFLSKSIPGGLELSDFCMAFNPKNVLIRELKGKYLATQVDATGTLDNLFDYAIRNKPLKASIDLKADEFNLREWIRAGKIKTTADYVLVNEPLQIPDNVNFTVHASADKFHFDNLDLQNVSCKMVISDETVQLIGVKANGMDGDIAVEGTYSTKESRENPEFALTYDVKGLDIQKSFFAFNTVRKIIPVGKFMTGNINAHLTMSGRLQEDMAPALRSIQGEGSILLVEGSMKDFSPLDKLSQSLDIDELKNIPLKNTETDFTFKSGKVIVSPFTVLARDIEMEIGGSHGYDQSLDYDINLKVPRSQLGNKGSMFVKNVVNQAADKGIPVKLKEAVNLNVKMGGTINSPDVKTDMNAVVENAETDLKKEVNDFVNAKLDSAKQELHHPSSATKKPLFVQASYKPKANSKPKKVSGSAHKKTVHAKSKKKKKKSGRHYSASLNKEKSTASNSRKK